MVDVRLDHAHALNDDVMNAILDLIHHGYSMCLLYMVEYRLIASFATLVLSSIVLDVIV